jgi:malate permease and related proteins
VLDGPDRISNDAGLRLAGPMTLFADILTKVTLPIIALVALGYLLQPRLKLDVPTLNRVQVYVVMPAFLIHFLSAGKQPLAVVWPVFYFGIVQFMILIPVGWLLVLLFRMRRSLGPMMGLGTAYANVGFFGIPVTQLAFGPDYLIHQSVLTALMAILVCTLGVWMLAPAGEKGLIAKLRIAFETPLIPSVAVGLLLRGFEVELPAVLFQPMQFLGSIFTPLALYTLGAGIAAQRVVRFEAGPQLLILFLKFLLAPAVSWIICIMMGLSRDVTDVIVVAASTPVGVLITIFAAEYKTEAEFISTAVVITTALSPLFVTAWILAVRMI